MSLPTLVSNFAIKPASCLAGDSKETAFTFFFIDVEPATFANIILGNIVAASRSSRPSATLKS
jgi:hypothetical protein